MYLLTPTNRPGIMRAKFFFTAIKAGCGPPKKNGKPKRCALPTATSAPISAGDLINVRDNISDVVINKA